MFFPSVHSQCQHNQESKEVLTFQLPKPGLIYLAMYKRANIIKCFFDKKPSWLSGWCAGVGILCPRVTGSIPAVTTYLVWDGGQWRDS